MTYTTVLALLPFLAIVFSVLKGFGAQNSLEPMLTGLAGDSSGELVARILGYVNSTNVSSLGIIGFLMLLVTMLTLLSTIEEAFNLTWGVRETRPLRKRLGDYLVVVIIGPLLLVLAVSMASAIESRSLLRWLIANAGFGGAIHVVFRIISWLFVWGALTSLYIYMPNIAVSLRSAVFGSLIAGTIWQAAQWCYFYFQIGVVGYNAIYGTLASLPFFLVWVYTSWIIVLLGLELVKLHQLEVCTQPSVRTDRRTTPAMRRLGLPPERKRLLRRIRLPFSSVSIALFSALIAMPGFVSAAPSSIKVVMDDNYPPYVFRSEDGKLQGILPDTWRLWEKKTGIRADIRAMDWAEAQKGMDAGEFDVIDTIFKTPEMELKYLFSKPYATLEVPVFFNAELAGIRDADSIRGFRVAVKEGDAAISYLKEKGVDELALYPSYEAIIKAAKAQKVAVFVADKPPSLYLLHKYGLQDRFRHSAPLYSGEFHRAFRKNHPETMAIVESGFASISGAEYESVLKNWLGIQSRGAVIGTWIFYGTGAALFLIGILLLWNRTLKRMVDRKTKDLVLSEKKYRELVQEAGSIILRWDCDGKITFMNDFGLDFFGYTENDLIGRHICDTIVPELESDGRNLRDMIADIFKFPENYRNNLNENIKSDGKRAWISWSNQTVCDNSGNTLEILSIGVDVTELKAAQKALSMSEERFRALIDLAPDAILQGDLSGAIIGANRMAEELTGYDIEELLGKNISVLFSEEELERQPLRYDLLNDGMLVKAERLLVRKDSTPIPVEMNTRRMPDNTYQAFLRDFSERKQIEDALKKARNDAEAANEAKSLFLANMSHEIRTPLNAIIGINSIMKERLEPGELRDLVGDSSIAARNLLEIISDVLDISKIEAGKLQIVSIPFELRLIVNQLERMFSMLAKEKGVDLHVSMASGLPQWLKGDPARIQQIGVNLLSNAIKFTEEGKVSLQVSGRSVGDDDNFILELAVQDSGKGIDPENLDMIFNPFVQEDLTTTRKYGGTGLGLAISLQLAKLMGGTIVADSQPGDGSRFVCTILCTIAAPVKHREPVPISREYPMRQLKILVAEDSLVNRKMMEAILRMERHNAKFVDNGRDAVSVWSKESFDLILMDIQMPEMDGIQATIEIRALEKDAGRHIPIIALTAYAMAGDKERFIAAGMDGYLAKPITVEQLRETLIAYGGG